MPLEERLSCDTPWSAVAWHRFVNSKSSIIKNSFTKAVPGHRTPRSLGLLIKAVWHYCRTNKQVTVNQPPWTSFAGQSRTFPACCLTPDRVRQIGIHVANRRLEFEIFSERNTKHEKSCLITTGSDFVTWCKRSRYAIKLRQGK